MSLPSSSSNWYVHCRWTYFLRTAFQFDCPGQQLGTLGKSNVFKPEPSPLVADSGLQLITYQIIQDQVPTKHIKVTKSTNPHI